MEDSRSQLEHLFEQKGMLFGIMRLNDHNHDGNCLLDPCGARAPSTAHIVTDSRSQVSGLLRK
jgi:hypothetical protein